MRKLIAALVLTAALAGCAGTQLQPPGMPTIATIEATETQLAAVGDVPDFYKVGLFLAQQQCGGFFDQAVMLALRRAQTAGEAQLLSGLLTGLMGLSGAGGQAVGATGLVSNAIGNMLGTAQDNALAGSDPAATATLVAAAQSALIAAEANPATAADAMADIYAVYRACSPAGIRGLEESAIEAAPNHLVVTGGAPASPTDQVRGLKAHGAGVGTAARLGMPASAALPMVRVR